jgi:hypothetical protein
VTLQHLAADGNTTWKIEASTDGTIGDRSHRPGETRRRLDLRRARRHGRFVAGVWTRSKCVRARWIA